MIIGDEWVTNLKFQLQNKCSFGYQFMTNLTFFSIENPV